jgi:hypothetical protein
MEAAKNDQRKKRRQPAGPLAEVYRRLVRIHVSAASTTNDDPKIRPWVVHQLMDVLHYIESVEEDEGMSSGRSSAPVTNG